MAVEKLTFEMNAVGNAVPEMKKVQNQLGKVNQSMSVAQTKLRQHANANHALVRSNKSMTRGLGMASLQFQDMAVQASMGTSALRIMTMQGPQLASVFGPKGMILGAVIAIGGAFAMLGDKSTKLTFDFKKLFADTKSALAPFIAFVQPALTAIGKAFDFLKNAGMVAVNGLINGLNTFAIFISHVPKIIGEAFERSSKRIQLFKVRFALFINDLQFRWTVFSGEILETFAKTVDSLASIMNDFMGTTFATDSLENVMKSTNNSMKLINRQMGGLIKQEDQLRSSLNQPYESIGNLSKDLENMTKIDLFSYFKRVKKGADDAADAAGKITTIADMIGEKFESAFMSMVKGTMSMKDAFRSMATDIIGELYRIFVVKQITGFITKSIQSMFPSFASIPARANGGPVGANTPYMVGERGPELFVPARSGSITPNERLTGGGGSVVVQQTINVTTGIQQTVRNEIQTLLPQIAEASKAAVLDARRRGGSFANAF